MKVTEQMVSDAYTAWANAKVQDPTDTRERFRFAIKAALRDVEVAQYRDVTAAQVRDALGRFNDDDKAVTVIVSELVEALQADAREKGEACIGDDRSHDQRIILAMAETIASISEALGLAPDDDPECIFDVIEELKAAVGCVKCMGCGEILDEHGVFVSSCECKTQEYTYGHCDEKNRAGGCQKHNLQCGYPDCDRRPIATKPAQASEPEGITLNYDGISAWGLTPNEALTMWVEVKDQRNSKPLEAAAVAVGKAVYQWRDAYGAWNDASQSFYDACTDRDRRILYTHPQPVTPAGGEVRFPRVETGVVQFGDDWPGVFIRGDNAAATAMYLRGDSSDPWRDAIIKSHADLLESCNVANKPNVRHIATHPPVADAALRDAFCEEQYEAFSRFKDAALNQRGGGDHG